MPKVLIVNSGGLEERLFTKYSFEICNSIEEADLLCFTGGEDVSPNLYGHQKHPQTYHNTHRDDYEVAIYKEAKELGIPMVGICRGGQFLNVMSGGEMYQHVSAHTKYHMIEDVDTGEPIHASSTHHQMMKPKGNFIRVATAHEHGWREWMDGGYPVREEGEFDEEVVFYPDTKCLCFQPHPEYNNLDELKDYFIHCIQKYLDVFNATE